MSQLFHGAEAWPVTAPRLHCKLRGVMRLAAGAIVQYNPVTHHHRSLECWKRANAQSAGSFDEAASSPPTGAWGLD
eukprot:256889-Amphidinium_carterae.1